MTCKDCIHYEPCFEYGNILDPIHGGVICNSFKNKADYIEVKHEKWELKSQIYKTFDDVDEEFYVECPLCKRTFYVPFECTEEKMLKYAKENYPYCNCGAKMDIE